MVRKDPRQVRTSSPISVDHLTERRNSCVGSSLSDVTNGRVLLPLPFKSELFPRFRQVGTSPDARLAAPKWEELTNCPKTCKTPSPVEKFYLKKEDIEMPFHSLIFFVLQLSFLRALARTLSACDLFFRFLTVSAGFLLPPLFSRLLSASPLSRCLLSPAAVLLSVTSALHCHLLHRPDVLSSALHLPAPFHHFFFFPPPPKFKLRRGAALHNGALSYGAQSQTIQLLRNRTRYLLTWYCISSARVITFHDNNS